MQDGLQLTSRCVTMSRDTKASCTDCQGHETSTVSFASPFPVDMKRDESNEPERSVRPVSSFVATTCASDTDEGDYETPSEEMILSKRSGTRIHGAQESLCVYLKEKSASLSKRTAFNENLSAIKGEIISDLPHELMGNRKITYICDSLIFMSKNLAQSKSLPILKSEIPRVVSTDFTAADVPLMSASSSSRKRKMSMIMKKMAPLISPYPSTVSLTTGATANFRGRRHETRRLTSRTMLPVLCDTMINDERSATLHETKNKRQAMNWDPRRDAIPTFANDEGAANVTNDDDDLVDVARNSHPSIKSVYFPPNLSESLVPPYDFGKSKRHQPRVSTDVEALLKIDHELGPLRCRYSEVIGKARALSLSGFDLDISCRLNRPVTFDQFMLSPSASNYLPDRNQTYLRSGAVINSGIENRSALVDKTTSSSTFSVVGKPTPRGSRTSRLNENGLSCRQEALSFTVRDASRKLQNFDGPRSFSSVRNSAPYFPATNSYTFHGKNVLNDRFRNGCVSNSNFQPYPESKAVIERATSALGDWLAHETINTNPSSVLNRTEYDSHRYLSKTVEDSRMSTNNSLEILRRKSSVSIVIDNNWFTLDKETANDGHSEIPSGNRNSTVVETEFASCGSNYRKSILPGAEHVAKDDRVSSPLVLESIDSGAPGPDCGILRTVSASTSQIRVINVNTEFRTTVEKRYTSRAVSPIQYPCLTNPSTSPSNVLLAKISSIFVQQVRADSSGEVAKIESPTKTRSIDANKRDAFADAASKRDFSAQKVDSRLATENPSRPFEFENDEADLTTTGFRRAQYLCLPRAKEKLMIVPIVLTDGISKPLRTSDVDFTIPKYPIKVVPKLNCKTAPFDPMKFHATSLSSIRDNERYRRNVADTLYSTERVVDEKRRRAANRTSVSHVNRHLCAEKDYPPSSTSIGGHPKRPTRVTTSNARVARKAREYREFDRNPKVTRTIPGMRSTPEDFLCET